MNRMRAVPTRARTGTLLVAKRSGETGPHIGFRLCLLAMGWLKAVFFSSHETFLKATLSAECSGARDYLSVMNRLPEEYFRGLRKPVSPYNFSANGSCASF